MQDLELLKASTVAGHTLAEVMRIALQVGVAGIIGTFGAIQGANATNRANDAREREKIALDVTREILGSLRRVSHYFTGISGDVHLVLRGVRGQRRNGFNPVTADELIEHFRPVLVPNLVPEPTADDLAPFFYSSESEIPFQLQELHRHCFALSAHAHEYQEIQREYASARVSGTPSEWLVNTANSSARAFIDTALLTAQKISRLAPKLDKAMLEIGLSVGLEKAIIPGVTLVPEPTLDGEK